MEDRINIIEKLSNKSGREKIIILILIGVLLLVIAIPVKENDSSKNISVNDTSGFYSDWSISSDKYNMEYSTFVEEKLKKILGEVDGVGDVMVMVSADSESGKIDGVIVVAGGGDDGTVAANITSALEALLGLPAHKIKVLKMS